MQNFQPKFFYHLYSHKIFFWLFLLTFCLQISFWYKTENVKAKFDIVPLPPSKYLTSAASLGDKEFLFRVLGTRLQNSGDVFAGFTALKNYDYLRLYNWFKSLDELNSKSNFIPALASYYYSQTQKTADTKYIIDYLDEHSAKDLDNKWWWLFQAIFIAKNSLKDMDRALDLAYKMSQNNSKTAPLWTKEMPAFLHAEMGDSCLAFKIIEKLIQESESGKRVIAAEEMNFMRHFIKYRLSELEKQKFDPSKCRSKI